MCRSFWLLLFLRGRFLLHIFALILNWAILLFNTHGIFFVVVVVQNSGLKINENKTSRVNEPPTLDR
jgi:hypothetical protein